MKKQKFDRGSASLIGVLLIGILASMLLAANMEKTVAVQHTSIVLRESALSTVSARNAQESLLTFLKTAGNRQNLAKKLTPKECKENKEPSTSDEIVLSGLIALEDGVKIYGNIHQVNCGVPTNADFRLRYKIIARINCNSSDTNDCATSSISGWYLNDAGIKAYDLKLCTAGTTAVVDNNAVFAETVWRSQLTVGGDIMASPSGTATPYKIQADWGENKQFQPRMPSLDIFNPIQVGGQIGNPSNKTGTDLIVSTSGAMFDGLTNTIDISDIIPKSDPSWNTSRFFQSIWNTSVLDTSTMVDSKLGSIAIQKDNFLKNFIGLTNQQAIDYTNQTITLPASASKNIAGESKIVSLLDLAEAQANYSPGQVGAVSLMHIKPSATTQVDVQTGKSYYLALGLGKNKKHLSQWEHMKTTDQHWLIDRWNDTSKCREPSATSCPNFADQNQGVSDNTVVIIDGNVKMQDLQYPSAAAIIVLGDVIVEGDVILHSNLIVQGNLHLRGNLILNPRFWFGKIQGSSSCTTALSGSKVIITEPAEGTPSGFGELAPPSSTTGAGANGAKSS